MTSTFVMYSNYYDVLKDTPNEDIGAIFRAVLCFAKTGQEIELPPHLKLAFGFLKNQMIIDAEKYQKSVKSGKRGGRPKTENQNEKNIQPAKEPDENENVNVNENVNNSLRSEYSQPSVNNREDEELMMIKEREIFKNSDDSEDDRHQISDKRTDLAQSSIQSDNSRLNTYSALSIPSQSEIVNDEEREILEKYIRKHCKGVKNLYAYIRKLIENGDFLRILQKEKERIEREKQKQSGGEVSESGYFSARLKNTTPGLIPEGGVPPPPNCTLEAVKKRIEENRRKKMALESAGKTEN